MTKHVIELVLASAVATNGTFTVNYPTGTSLGTFQNGKVHKMIANQTLFTAPVGFTISFADNTATITYKGTTTLAAGTPVTVELDAAGTDTIYGVNTAVKKVQPVLIDLGAPDTADADGYFASQDLTTAGVASVSTTVAAAITAAALGGTADVARNVVAAWTGAAVITITGTDVYGNAIVEKSASGTSLTGKKAFKTVTGIAVSANVTSLTVGTGDVIGLPVFVGDVREVVAEFIDGTIASRFGDYVQIPFQLTEAELDAGGSFWIFPGFAGNVVDMGSVVENTVTTGGTITVEIGGTAVDGLGLVIADSSAAGDVDTDAATAGHATTAFTAAQALEIVVPSAFNASAPINGWIGVNRSTRTDSTFVAGLSPLTVSSATTADVRGTYDPSATCNGTKAYKLLALLEDPTFLGNPQYTG